MWGSSLTRSSGAGVPAALLGFWETAPLGDPTRGALLKTLKELFGPERQPSLPVPSQPVSTHPVPTLPVSSLPVPSPQDEYTELMASLRARFLRSLPKLLWQLQASDPRLSEAILATLLEIGRAGDELQPLQAALGPFFCATRRRNQSGAAALLGPYRSLPAPARQAARHVLARCHPMHPALVESLAAGACEAPEVAQELLGVVDWAWRRGSVDLATWLSFLWTVALEARQEAGSLSGTTATDHCASILARRLLEQRLLEQGHRPGGGMSASILSALRQAYEDEEAAAGSQARDAARTGRLSQARLLLAAIEG